MKLKANKLKVGQIIDMGEGEEVVLYIDKNEIYTRLLEEDGNCYPIKKGVVTNRGAEKYLFEE